MLRSWLLIDSEALVLRIGAGLHQFDPGRVGNRYFTRKNNNNWVGPRPYLIQQYK